MQDYLNKITQGDCVELMRQLPDKSVDMIFTDPPYGINFNDNNDLVMRRERTFLPPKKTSSLASKHEWVFKGKEKDSVAANPIANDSPVDALALNEALFTEAARILKKDGCICCCIVGGGNPDPVFPKVILLMDKYLLFKQAVVWAKSMGMGIHYRRSYEFVLVAGRKGGRVKWHGGKKTTNVFGLQDMHEYEYEGKPYIVEYPKIVPSKDQHPTEKPVSLAQHFILLHSNPGDIVLDPFCGSGSTLEACLKTDRQFIGFELEPKYVDMATSRVKRIQAQTKLF